MAVEGKKTSGDKDIVSSEVNTFRISPDESDDSECTDSVKSVFKFTRPGVNLINIFFIFTIILAVFSLTTVFFIFTKFNFTNFGE